MSAGVETGSIRDQKFDAKKQLDEYLDNKGIVLACGAGIKSRNQPDSEACPLSTMFDCVQTVVWADKTVTF